MAIEVQLPDIGADAAEVTEILVTVGDSVELDAPLLVVEGEKAAMEIPSPQAGTVAGIQVAVGDEVTSGTTHWRTWRRTVNRHVANVLPRLILGEQGTNSQ